MAACVCLTIVSGSADIVALSLSLVGMVSGNIKALDSNNSEGGTFLFKLKSNHWSSCALKRSWLKPYARMPLALHACCTSDRVSVLTPSFWIILSSAANERSFILSWKRRKLLVPNVCTSSTLQRAINWLLDRESSVISSWNSFANRIISSVDTCSPVKKIYMQMIRTNVLQILAPNVRIFHFLWSCNKCNVSQYFLYSLYVCGCFKNIESEMHYTLKMCYIFITRLKTMPQEIFRYFF